MTRATLLGLMAGSLFWIRYASVFVPAALIMFLLVERCRKRVGTSIVAGFLVASLVPIGLLILINNLLGPSSSTTAAFNLGSTIAPTFSPSSITEAWVTFTALGYFDHRPLARALLACWPMIAVAILGITSWRRRRDRVSRSTLDSSTVAWERMRTLPKHSKRAHDRESVTSHGFGRCGLLNGCVLVVALLMLVTATSLFGAKYHYVALERYYLPIRPMYFALFVMPLLAWRSRLLHAAVATAMLPLLLWTVQVDGIRAYERGIITQSKRSPYGMWARCFTPEPAALTAWLKARNHPGLVVVSNYHEYLALETGMVILPIPSDRTALEHGIERIAEQRNVDVQEVLFVMDPDNRWRSHWIADPHEVADMFDLKQTVVRFDDSDVRVFRYESMKAALTDATR